MSGTYFIIGFAVLVFLLIITRRRAPKAGSRDSQTHHGKFREYVQERNKAKGQFFGESEVHYREEKAPFAVANDRSTVAMMNLKMADDPHGVFGEAATSAIVERVAHDSGRRYKLFQNVYIPTHAGYTEIDTVLLHETGVYVFETKNVSGEVFGDLEMERWKLHLNERTEHTLYNPLKQNQGHIGALLRQLRVGYERARVYSFVVFSDRCVLKHVPAKGMNWQVIHFGELRNALGKIMQKRACAHDKRRMEEWGEALSSCVNVSEKVKQQHRAQVHKMHQN